MENNNTPSANPPHQHSEQSNDGRQQKKTPFHVPVSKDVDPGDQKNEDESPVKGNAGIGKDDEAH